jgi:hypothetical protein
MATLALETTFQHLDQLPNSYPVYLFTLPGAAHDVDEGGWRTTCGLRIDQDHGQRITVAQVQVWLNHSFCMNCFTGTR